MSAMPKSGEEVQLYLEQIVREDFIGLYGFETKEELEMFKLLFRNKWSWGKGSFIFLLSISRINNLKCAIITGDDKQLCKAPGIGKKQQEE